MSISRRYNVICVITCLIFITVQSILHWYAFFIGKGVWSIWQVLWIDWSHFAWSLSLVDVNFPNWLFDWLLGTQNQCWLVSSPISLSFFFFERNDRKERERVEITCFISDVVKSNSTKTNEDEQFQQLFNRKWDKATQGSRDKKRNSNYEEADSSGDFI